MPIALEVPVPSRTILRPEPLNAPWSGCTRVGVVPKCRSKRLSRIFISSGSQRAYQPYHSHWTSAQRRHRRAQPDRDSVQNLPVTFVTVRTGLSLTDQSLASDVS